ncbi:hypothetical protein TrCOL_g2822 [Triparma columacea]|uniref:Uncharacterized protein n=1 Tax=Triparma columacea TaxID=722753 RepID=A0A9W7L8N5_9STRA|nr:hypothetical protein TrCOL_g2822 [Triparma columacea]
MKKPTTTQNRHAAQIADTHEYEDLVSEVLNSDSTNENDDKPRAAYKLVPGTTTYTRVPVSKVLASERSRQSSAAASTSSGGGDEK